MSDSAEKAAYPKREKYFAHKAVRLMFKSCAAFDIGHLGALLVVHIAHTEDAARYRGPVRFWNSQLQNTLCISKGQLLRAREAAIKGGWLHYERDTNRSVGRYWVTVPEDVAKLLDDSPIEPVGEWESLANGSTSEPNERGNGFTSETNTDGMVSPVSREAGDSWANHAPTSNPSPNPSPTREAAARPALPDGSPLTVDYLVSRWNQIPGVVHCREFTAKRRTAFRARCGKPKWVAGLPAALERVAASGFCQGEGQRGWRADMDWLLKPDTLTKILEGKYDSGGNGDGKAAPTKPPVIFTAGSDEPHYADESNE